MYVNKRHRDGNFDGELDTETSIYKFSISFLRTMSYQGRASSESNRNSSRGSAEKRVDRRRTVSGPSYNNNRSKTISYTNNSQKLMSQMNGFGSNIQVYVRCRSRNQREIDEKSSVVISTMGPNGKEVILSSPTSSTSLSYPKKTYVFDQVFGAESDQDLVFNVAAKNYIQEMMDGYNCTVFAYGQTGTGKTYTMSGDINILGDVESQDKILLGEHAGIIPRVLVDLFQGLSNETNDYSVKISFLELYNERLKDLLANNDSDDETIRIFDNYSNGSSISITNNSNQNSTTTNSNNNNNHHNSTNKINNAHHTKQNLKNNTYSSIMVKGMEEIYIKSAYEGLQLLTEGSLKRKVASTKCNDLSSRSHTIFTITTNITKTDPISGEQYVKIGKLNLVDLAGSENINRSGAENKRAQEAGLINKSLLTLGRVINALVDHSQHIPYRESKLTRLLQDSLGGRTKTCIIATISPAKISSEETVSTLEYANRAKSIKNTPQVNQSMSKDVCLNEYVQEIERLRHELKASRQKDGVYVTQDQYDLFESNELLLKEQKMRIHNMEEQSNRFKQEYVKQTALNKELEIKMKEIEEMVAELQEQKTSLLGLFQDYERANNNFTGEIQKIHVTNIALIDDLKLERDEFFNDSVDYEKKLHSIKDVITEQKSNLSNLEETLNIYNSKFQDAMDGVYEEVEKQTISFKEETTNNISSVDFGGISSSIEKTQSSIKSSLTVLEQPRVNMITDPYTAHRTIIENCFKVLSKSIKEFNDLLTLKLDITASNIKNDLLNLSTQTNENYSLTDDTITTQKDQIIELEMELQKERKISSELDTKLKEFTDYFDVYVSNEKETLFQELFNSLMNFKTKQTDIDNNFLSRALSDMASIRAQSDSSFDNSMQKMIDTSVKSLSTIRETVTNNKVQLNEMISQTENQIPRYINEIPISDNINQLVSQLATACDEKSSTKLLEVLNQINEDIIHDNISIGNKVKDSILRLKDYIESDNQLKITIFEKIQSNVQDLSNYILYNYKENITQMAKTQFSILKEHTHGLSNVVTNLNKDTDLQNNNITYKEIKINPETTKIVKLPLFKNPQNYHIYRDLKSNEGMGENSLESMATGNLSPIHLPHSTMKFNPSTPVPVPDQPLPLPKVLMPRSVNSKTMRSNTVPMTLKQSSSRNTSPMKPNNLKRRFTLGATDKMTNEVKIKDESEAKEIIDDDNELEMNKKVHLDPNTPKLETT